MAIGSFGRGRDGEGAVAGPAAAPTTSGGGGGGLTAFIDQGSEFEGKLSFKDTVRIDGTFRGEISSENTLVVGETGEIDANIHSKNVVISGTVTGDVQASRQLVLHKTARLTGNVTAPVMVIEEGAVLNGQVTMKRPEDSLPRKSAPAPAKDTPKA